MKLEGSLDAFGLPDIFQLLSLTKKTGGLHLRGGVSAGVVYFADGAVTGADADLTRQTLARRLVGTGTVSDDALAAAVGRAQSDGIGVGRALLDAGAVDEEVVREAAAEVAGDAVFALLGWTDGDFAFSPDAVNPDDVGLNLATERVVSEAANRQQALDSASDVIGSGDLVLSLAAAPAHDPQLSRADWALVSLADGRRSVADIVDLTGQSYYAVVPSLAALVRQGLLEVRGEQQDHVTEVRRRLDLLAVLEGGSHSSAHDTALSDEVAAAAPAVAAAASSAVHLPAPAAARTAPTASAPLRTATVAVQPEPGEAVHAVHSADSTESADTVEPVEAAGGNDLVATIGGPHVPENVVPPRPEPFLARRQPEHPEGDHVPVAPATATAGATATATATAAASPAPTAAAASSRPAFGPPAAAATPRPTSGSVFSQPPGAPAAPASGATGGVGAVHGSAAMAADPEVAALIERDPSVNRSLLLRLIAGVRGL